MRLGSRQSPDASEETCMSCLQRHQGLAHPPTDQQSCCKAAGCCGGGARPHPTGFTDQAEAAFQVPDGPSLAQASPLSSAKYSRGTDPVPRFSPAAVRETRRPRAGLMGRPSGNRQPPQRRNSGEHKRHKARDREADALSWEPCPVRRDSVGAWRQINRNKPRRSVGGGRRGRPVDRHLPSWERQ